MFRPTVQFTRGVISKHMKVAQLQFLQQTDSKSNVFVPGFISRLLSPKTEVQSVRCLHSASVDFAARKGTRARKEKGKVKKEYIKKTFIERLAEKKANILHMVQRPPDNSEKPAPIDDVYFYEKFQDKIWSFAEAVQNHREVYHPTMRNLPKSPIIVRIDIDLVYPNRPNKMMDTWRSIVEMKSPFLLPGMSIPKIIAFYTPETEKINEILKAGADVCGSHELIKSIQEGLISLNEFEYVIAHPLMVTELTAIRGLLKRKFPTVKGGMADVDLISIIRRLKSGQKIEVKSSDREPDFAWIEAPLGKLDMSTEELESNLISILTDTLPRRVSGKLASDFIIQCSLKTPTSHEKFILDKEYYISKCDTVKSSFQPKKIEQVPESEQLVDTLVDKQPAASV